MTRKVIYVSICLSILCALFAPLPVHAIKYVKWDAPGPTHNGTSWGNAYLTIQEALNVAVDSEIINVAGATGSGAVYAEKIVFKTGAVLRGGFRGNVAAGPPDLVRDPATYVTIIDGGANTAGTRTVTSFANGSIDGFTIKGAATGIYCGTSFSVTGNTITSGNTGVYMLNTSPAVTGNRVSGGAIGLHCHANGRNTTCLADIRSNTITGYSQYGIYCQSVNSCDEYGRNCAWGNCSPTISENGIAGGQIGMYFDGEGCVAVVSDNAVSDAVTAVKANRARPNVLRNIITAGSAGRIGVQCDAIGRATYCQTILDGNTIEGFLQYGVTCNATRSCDAYGRNCTDGNCVPTIKNNTITRSGIHGIQCRRATPTISGNTITDSADCGVYCYNDVSADSMLALTIDGNTISGQNKGVYSKGVSIKILNNTIQLSREEGVLCDDGSTSEVINNMISGGILGVKCAGTIATPTNPKVHGNIIAGQQVAAILCQNSNSQIYGNLMASAGQYGIDCQGGYAQIYNNTIAKNGWYGIYVEAGTPEAYNNIVTGSPIGCYAEGGAPTLGNNNFWANDTDYYPGSKPASDIAVDPMFLCSAVGEYHLKPGSPCIDAGDNSKAGLPKDADGKDRILPEDGVVDIGCFEWEDPTVVPYWVRNSNQVKVLPSDYLIQMKKKVVSATWDNSLYIQDDNRNAGIRVEKAAHGLTGDNQRAAFTGTVQTSADGERYVLASSLSEDGMGSAKPVGLTGKSIGGSAYKDTASGIGQQGITGCSGLNNIGLFVRVWGRVAEVESVSIPAQPSWIKIDDGSGRLIKCVAEGGSPVIDPMWQNRYVAVTGISSCEFDGSSLVSKIRLKKDVAPTIY